MRGSIVSVALQGDYGKPRPAVIIQSDLFAQAHTTTLLLITSTLIDAPLFRLNVDPSPENGLRVKSQVMIDKVMTVRSDKIGQAFGHLGDSKMLEINRALALFIGLAN